MFKSKSKCISALLIFFIIVCAGVSVSLYLFGSGIIDEELYREKFTVTDVGKCNSNKCGIKMNKASDGARWNGVSHDIVVEGASVYLLCDKNLLTGKASCDGFYTYPDAKDYPPRTRFDR